MKKNRRSRIIALCMITIFVLSISSVYATDKIDSPMKGPRYDFKTEYGKTFTKTFTGLPGNQPTEGTRILSHDGKPTHPAGTRYIFQMLEDPLLVCL